MALHHLADWLNLAGTLLAAAAACYAAIALWATWTRIPAALPARAPAPVSVLKPLCGMEPGLYENLRSFCDQSHPEFELLFGVRDSGDPAAAVVRRLQEEYPGRRIRMIADARIHGSNLKVSNLINLLPHSAYDLLVIADSDIRVERDYLERVVAPLADPGVGMVTCLYRGNGRGGPWSRFGAEFISAWFAPSVRLAHRFGMESFSFGATIALRRPTLEAIGGFASVQDLLADDFWLGELTRRCGLRTILSDVIVTTDVIEAGFQSLWEHEVRWMRTIRSVAPAGFALVFVTFTFPILAAGLILSHTPLCLGICAAGAISRLALPAVSERGTGLKRALAGAALAPLRDVVLLTEWAAAHAGSSVQWRGQSFQIWPEREVLALR